MTAPDDPKAQRDQLAVAEATERINTALERARRFGAQIQLAPLEQTATLDAIVQLLIKQRLVTDTGFVRLKVERMADQLEAALGEIAKQAITAPNVPQAG